MVAMRNLRKERMMRRDEHEEGGGIKMKRDAMRRPLLRILFSSHGIVLSMESFILQDLSFQSGFLKYLFILIMYLTILNSNIT
jgi:hypothetical protein